MLQRPETIRLVESPWVRIGLAFDFVPQFGLLGGPSIS
jgi:hypothetical protein